MNIHQSPHKLPPANPIYTKPISCEQPKPIFRFQYIKNHVNSQGGNNREEVSRSSDCLIDIHKLRKGKGKNKEEKDRARNCYEKFDNKNMNVLRGVEYTSGLFMAKSAILSNTKAINNVHTLIRQFGSHSKSQFPTIQTNFPSSTITFDSNIQSGNLFSVSQSSATSFDLTLQNDINSKGNTQWFYFSVTNLPKDTDITFNIVNLLKSDSLFSYGMQPVVFSKTRNKLYGDGWKREGKCIKYKKSEFKRQGDTKKKYYQLSFTITSKIYGDTLQIAQCFPYTYTMMKQYISNIFKHSAKKLYCSEETIIKTPARNSLNVLTITNSKTQQDTRKIILIMARQHPGETQSSYVCQGLINFLLLKTQASNFLRENYIFKIIPMINPDGVVFGNYRSNLLGVDLNRKWQTTDKQTSPEVTAIKNYIKKLNGSNSRIRMVIDLHGHSRKLGSFFYGNPNQQFPEQPRLLPYVCSKLSKQVSFDDCTFAISTDKISSARVFLHQKLQIKNVYTYEVSFYGSRKDGKIVQFGIDEYRKLGANLCEALHNILESQINTLKINQYEVQLKTNSALLKVGEDDNSGSDSKPDECELLKEDFQQFDQHKISKTSKIINLQHLFTEDQSQEPPRLDDQIIPFNIQSAENSTRDCFNRMRKKIKSVLPMNQINSKPFHRYQLGLEPSVTPNIKIKVTQKVNRSFKQMYNDVNKTSAYTQTSDDIDQNLQNSQCPLFLTRRNNKSLSTTSAARRTLILKLDVTPKLSFFMPNPNAKFVDVATQTNISNLLGGYPNIIKQSSTQLLNKSHQKLSSVLNPVRGTMQRMSLDERSTDLVKRRGLRPIIQKVKLQKRVKDVEKLLQVKKKHIFDNSSKSMSKR